MKVVFALILLAACAKPNELATLQDEAATLEKFHQKQLDAFAKRLDDVFHRAMVIPPNLPSTNEVGKLVGEAQERIVALRQILGPCATPNGRREPKWVTQCQTTKTPFQQQVEASLKASNP